MNSASEIFENRIRNEKDSDIVKLKATIVDVVSENLEIKKRLEIACRGGDRYEILIPEIKLTVEKAVKRSGFAISGILRKIGIQRSWYYG